MPRVTNRLDAWAEMLKLSKDQKKDVKSAMDDGQKEAAPILDQLMKSRSAIAEALASGKSQEDIKPLLNAHGAIEAQMATVEMNTFAKVFKTLDSGQQNMTRRLFPAMHGIFNGKNWNSME